MGIIKNRILYLYFPFFFFFLSNMVEKAIYYQLLRDFIFYQKTSQLQFRFIQQ